MSAEAARLRQQAERCLRLAQQTSDAKVAEALRTFAAESLAKAQELEQRSKR